MAALCHHFVQNAWKKDLCSNCFKSKEEHSSHASGAGEGKSRYLATMYPSRAHSWRQNYTPPQGILKDGQQVRRSKGSAVHFPAEESQVIGFGGDEFDPSDGEDEFEPEWNAIASDDDVADGEEDRALQKLTRTNTDFNTMAANLSGTGSSETKRTYTQLLLGKPLTDADGRRRTLQVSVTPFGGQVESDASPVTSVRKSHLGKLLHEQQENNKKIVQSASGKFSDIPDEKSGEIVLKSAVTNIEAKQENISNLEMTPNGNALKQAEVGTKKSFVIRNGIPHQNVRDVILKSLVKQNDANQIQENIANGAGVNSVEIAMTEISSNKTKEAEVTPNKIHELSLKLVCVKNVNKISKEIRENTSKSTENEAPEGKVSRIPVIRSRVSPEKLRIVSRTLAFNGRSDISNKPQEILPKPAVRKNSYESVRKLEDTTKKDATNSEEGISEDSDKSIKHEDSVIHRKGVNEICEASLSNSVTETEMQLVQNSENIINRRNSSTDTISKQSNIIDVDKVKHSDKNSTDAVVEMYNTKVKLKDSAVTLIADESKNIVHSVRDLDKNALINPCTADSNSKEMSGGGHIAPVKEETCNNMLDELVTEKEVLKDAASLSVRKIEGEPSVSNPVNLTAKSEDFLTSKLINGITIADTLIKGNDVDMFCVEESRELAGEPDGRADPDELTEPPALPRSPPPVVDPRPSFLHAITQVNALRKPSRDKPKIPVKPNTKILQAIPRRNFMPQSPKLPKKQENAQLQEGHNDAATEQQEQVTEVSAVECDGVEQLPQQQQQQQQSDALETARAHKRQAPKPPLVPAEDTSCPLFTRNPSVALIKSSPVAREKEKRERASSCSPKLCSEVVSQSPSGENSNPAPFPEPAPRRCLSLSVESLSSPGSVVTPSELEKKKSSHGRARFSLRKFLRFGGSKEYKTVGSVEVQRNEDVGCNLPVQRPRLEIIHPSELNGSNVEVLRGDSSCVRKHLEDSSSSASSCSENNKESEMSSDSGTSQSINSPNQTFSVRPTKPPPPPRNQSLDAWGKTIEGLNKPARPPPPKSAELLWQQKQPARQMQPTPSVNNLYANLGLISGEVRSGLAPSKPQRTSSIRDANVEGTRRTVAPQTDDSGYESVELSDGKHVSEVTENVYECLAPSSDGVTTEPNTVKAIRYNGLHQRRSEGSMDTSPDYVKFRGSFMRSTSLPYCGSETESDIYSPYSFYSSEDAGDDESERSHTSGHTWKTSKLRLRKGRSVVHKNLEDNYGAVIVANHEALAQVLEQVNVGSLVPPALRGLKTAVNLRWSDFTLVDDSRSVVVGKRSFHAAMWNEHGVTLSLAADQCLQNTIPSRSCFTLCPVTEFSDLVPAQYLPGQPNDKMDPVQAYVVVLNPMQVDTIQTYGTMLRGKAPKEEHWKDGSFVLLQLVNGLKTLQAQGIEEAPLSLSNFVLCREERDPQPRLCILQVLGIGPASEEGSLCQCALTAMQDLLPATAALTPLIRDLLHQERAVSLSQVKSLLEFSLWGPADVALATPSSDRELVLQRWLDLERATVLHGLVHTRVELTAFEECHLLFLVRTSAKMMCEASILLDSDSSNAPEMTNF